MTPDEIAAKLIAMVPHCDDEADYTSDDKVLLAAAAIAAERERAEADLAAEKGRQAGLNRQWAGELAEAHAAREKAEADLAQALREAPASGRTLGRALANKAAADATARAEKAEAERDEARQEAFNLRAKCGGCIKFDERVDLENRARATALRNAADTARRMHNEYAANAILELIDKEPDANG